MKNNKKTTHPEESVFNPNGLELPTRKVGLWGVTHYGGDNTSCENKSVHTIESVFNPNDLELPTRKVGLWGVTHYGGDNTSKVKKK